MDKKIAQIITDEFGIDTNVVLTRPEPQFGDYATNVALQLAGKLGKPPRDVATQIAEKLRNDSNFTEVNIAGPGFINLRVAAKTLEIDLDQRWSEMYGENNDGNGKVVVVEYPSPNMAKPYSVGHLRPSNQGWAAKRLMEVTGWKVITDNHLGDYGAPFGVWVVGFLQFSSNEQLEKEGIYELGRIYILMKKALKEESIRDEHILKDKVQDWLLRLESNDPEALDYSRRFNLISLEHIHNVMRRLRINTEHELGEAFFAMKGKEAVRKLLDANIARQNDDGSVIVPLDEYGFNVPLLVQKSNGAALYATTDLATILYREQEWHPSRVIYAVGAEQQFYFSQLFALAKKLGIKTELIHLWFGVIDQKNEDGSREKMSSRKGVVLLEELLDVAETKAREVTSSRGVSEEDIKRIALGAIKYSDFIADRRTNVLFDWDKIFALTGRSGPYVQYAAVRVNKILAAVGPVGDYGGYDYEAEKALILKLLEYPEVVRLAARDLEPHKVAAYLYELARELNRYYEKTRIVDAPNHEKFARINIMKKINHVFSHGLSILGIEIPQTM